MAMWVWTSLCAYMPTARPTPRNVSSRVRRVEHQDAALWHVSAWRACHPDTCHNLPGASNTMTVPW